MAVKELEAEAAWAVTSLGSGKATTEQEASFGPYRVKVIVPVGLVPRVRCATSFTDPPAATEPLAVVVSAGLALVTTTASAGAAQAVGAPAMSLLTPRHVPIPQDVSSLMTRKEFEV